MSAEAPAAAPRIVIVVAVARNGVIGRDNGMPWRLPSDLRHFRRLTMGRPIVMGRKTFESIGRPLDGRTNIVVTRDPAYRPAGVEVVHSLDEAIRLGAGIAAQDGVGEVMITGGGQIYAEALPLADRVHLTEVDLAPEGGTRFPPLDPAEWREIAREAGVPGPKDEAGFAFVAYARRTTR